MLGDGEEGTSSLRYLLDVKYPRRKPRRKARCYMMQQRYRSQHHHQHRQAKRQVNGLLLLMGHHQYPHAQYPHARGPGTSCQISISLTAIFRTNLVPPNSQNRRQRRRPKCLASGPDPLEVEEEERENYSSVAGSRICLLIRLRMTPQLRMQDLDCRRR